MIALLDTLSQEHYNGIYLPGAPLYDQYRPPRWAVNKTLCRANGLPPNRHGWRRLVEHLGFTKPVAERGVTWNPQISAYRHDKDPAPRGPPMMQLDAPLEWPGEQQREIRRRGQDGLPAILRQRSLMAWCI
ncbi:MAG: hypothetical protein DCC55_35060, partial [Chloroflexi bacterium]